MIGYIKPQELIKSNQFVREPVDSISKDIMKSSSKKIILNGGRGSGKSVVLHNIEDKGIGTSNQTIFIQFDSIINFSVSPNEYFDGSFFNHYYELIFSWKLLSYIKKNYILLYEKSFKDIETLLKIISKDTDDCLNEMYFEKKLLKKYLVPTEISSQILERFKKELGIDSLNLAVDRFDWINGSSDYVQHIISRYFDLFDKTIIVADDISLDEKTRKDELEGKGYSFVSSTYGMDIDVIKQIIKKRVRLYNELIENSNKNFDESIITDKIYRNLVSKSNGNITLILNTFKEIADLLNWHGGFVEDLEHQFDIETDNQIGKIKQLRIMDATPPKFYL